MARRFINKEEFERTIGLYWMWKDLNNAIKEDYSRGVNLHECLTEKICCYINGFKSSLGEGSEDAIDPKTGNKIQIKGTSNWDKDLTSFGPNSEFDELHFARLDQDNDELYFYKIPIDNLYETIVNVNKNETFKDQQNQQRRPRLSIINKIIAVEELEPYAKVDLETEEIIHL